MSKKNCLNIIFSLFFHLFYNEFSMFIAEAATHKQIDYVEIDDVKYGFVASTDKRHGLMRFKPGAKKEYEKSCGVIVCIGYCASCVTLKRVPSFI